MIYLFAGTDTKAKHRVYEKFIKDLPSQEETFFIAKNNFDRLQVESFFSGAGLFFKKCTVFFENVFEKEEILDFILEKLELMANSTNDFVFLEGKLNKPILDAFKKARAELNIFELTKEKKERFNSFLLADDFSQKNKFSLWLHFREAIESGVKMEELIGILFWKAKDMLLKKSYGKFSEDELKGFVKKISYLLPEARKNGIDDEAVFEQFLLEAF